MQSIVLNPLLQMQKKIFKKFALYQRILIVSHSQRTSRGGDKQDSLAARNDENLLIFESAGLAAAYDKYFNALFAQYQKTGLKLPPA